MSLSEGWVIFLVGEAIVIFGALVGIYVRVSMKLTELEQRMKVSENRLKDVEDTEKSISLKLDTILDKVHEVKVELQLKENRK